MNLISRIEPGVLVFWAGIAVLVAVAIKPSKKSAPKPTIGKPSGSRSQPMDEGGEIREDRPERKLSPSEPAYWSVGNWATDGLTPP